MSVSTSRTARHRALALLTVVGLAVPATALVVVGAPAPAGAATFTVSNGNDNGAGSLRAAFVAATASTDPSNTIVVNPGVGTVTLTSGELLYNPANNSALTIQGNGVTILQTHGNSRVIDDASTGPLTVQNATITGGNTPVGSAISSGGDVTLVGSTVAANTSGSSASGADTFDIGNTQTNAITLTNTTVSGNTVTAAGTDLDAGIINAGNTTVTGSTIANNSDSQTGTSEAIGTFDTNATAITGSMITGNHTTAASNFAGGTFDTGVLTITGSTIANNTNRAGGTAGGTIDSTSLALTQSAITGNANAATGSGTASGTVDTGVATLVRSSVTGNTNSSATGTAEGGIDAGSVSATDSTISGNVASGSTSLGGGIDDAPGPDTSGSTPQPKHPTAHAAASGGTVLVYATVTGNEAASGANIHSVNQLSAFGSVVALPKGSTDCVLTGPTTVSHGWNFDTDTSCGFTNAASGDRSGGGDPSLGTLAGNGGTGPTQLPQPGSPLIDAIPVASCQADGAAGITVDERGVSRPQGGGCDIGAVEVATAALVVTPRFTG